MFIKRLTLYTPRLSDQTEFYNSVLNLELLEKNDCFSVFKVGRSLLKLKYREKATPYHFAFNIPSNDKDKALEWLKERVDVLKDEESEIQYFDFWEAHAIYFYDKDRNIVEFISRVNRGVHSDKRFDSNSILEISEIGLPTNNIEQIFNAINESTGIDIFSGSFDSFCAMGSDSGLIICVDYNLKKEWYPTKDIPYASDFEMEIENGGKLFKISYQNELLEVDKH